MIGKSILPSRLAALSACLAVMLVGSLVVASGEPVTLNGEIEVAEFDEDGEPKAAAIYDSEWGSVLISNAGKGQELLNHVGAIAEITGNLVELDDDSGYSYSITVSDYTIVEPAEGESDEAWHAD